MFKPSQYKVRLQEVEDMEVQQYLVRVEVLQLDREKFRSALIAIDGIWGVCRLLTGGCFRCGSLENLIA